MPKSIALNEALAVRPDETIPNLQHFLLIRSALERMKLARTEEQFKETAAYLWEIALGIDEGNLTQAEKRRLRDAQQALSKALENGATDQEIAKLMKELREAMQNYMAELGTADAERADDSAIHAGAEHSSPAGLAEDDGQIENLARSGDRSAGQQMLSQLQQMMNSLQAGRPQRGQQGQQQQNGKMRSRSTSSARSCRTSRSCWMKPSSWIRPFVSHAARRPGSMARGPAAHTAPDWA